MEKYSSGWRGAPAKGVDRLRGARVQIPPSPFFVAIKSGRLVIEQNKSKKILKSEVIAYDDLGAEAIRKLEVEYFPVVVVIDSKGNNLYENVLKK